MNPQSEIQVILRQRFSEIKSRNPRFSVRAFAKQLGLQASATNEIMKGQRNISRALAEKILGRMKLSAEERMSIYGADESFTACSFPISEEKLKIAMEVLRRAKHEIESLSAAGDENKLELTVVLSAHARRPGREHE